MAFMKYVCIDGYREHKGNNEVSLIVESLGFISAQTEVLHLPAAEAWT